MIDLKNLEKNFDEVKTALMRKGVEEHLIKSIKETFEGKKAYQKEQEEAKANLNKLSKEFGQRKRENADTTDIATQIEEEKYKLEQANLKLDVAVERLNHDVMGLPNIPDIDVPDGVDEDDNVIIEVVGEVPEFDFEPKNHWDLAEGRIDFERGVKVAKSRFSILRNDTAKLERALINFFLDENAKAGFEEVSVPYINNRRMLEGTGQLPKFEDDLFKIEGEDLFLIPTGEVPLTNMLNDEILTEDELPVMLTANTPCFRKEAGGAGRDTRGMIRQHQFNKVEMVAITKPEDSDEMLNKMVNHASKLLTKLQLPHRIVRLCTGDLGFSAAKTIDLEVWLPGQNKYREISSISNTRDFQARRAKIRYKAGKKNELVHTLNGSGLAVGRTIVALMENYQQEDGTILIPGALYKYIRG